MKRICLKLFLLWVLLPLQSRFLALSFGFLAKFFTIRLMFHLILSSSFSYDTSPHLLA